MKTKQKTQKRSIAGEVARLEERCEKLVKERRQLKADLKKTAAERDQYLKSLYKLMREEIDIDVDEIRAQVDKKHSMHDLIAELKSRAGRK